MNSIMTTARCEQRIQAILKELEFADRNNVVEDSTWFESSLRARRDEDESE